MHPIISLPSPPPPRPLVPMLVLNPKKGKTKYRCALVPPPLSMIESRRMEELEKQIPVRALPDRLRASTCPAGNSVV
jgi:hypothetical protein